jgi:xanthine dehydrogenase accessory factor
MNGRKTIYPEVLLRLESQEPVALATIIQAEGATPQVPGASALFGETGLLLGTLGGGALEADAEKKALLCLKKKSSLYYRFDLQGEDLASGEPVCGGFVWILIEGSPGDRKETWRRLSNSLLVRRSGVLVTQINRGHDDRVDVERVWLDEKTADPEDGVLLRRFTRELVQARRQEKAALIQEQGTLPESRQTLFFLEPVAPLPRLLIVGAGHIGQALARQAAWLDFDVTVIDDRADYASRDRFAQGASLVVADIEGAVREFPVSPDTYIVIVTRGHSHDAEALRACLHSPAAYIGMIGSRHKVALMRERFLEAGWASAQEWDRVRAPIGLKIGSRTVEEIAVSIAAELVQVRSRIRETQAGEDI